MLHLLGPDDLLIAPHDGYRGVWRVLDHFDLHGVKIGIQICYDRKYPEGSRLLALKGAEILFMPICAAT